MTITTNPRATWSVTAVVCLGLLIAGCGGDNGGSSGGGSDPSRLTTSQFVEQANAVCDRNSERVKEVSTESVRLSSAARARSMLPVFDEAIAQLGELRPPQKLEAEYEQYLSRLRRGRDLYKQALSTPDPYANMPPELDELTKEDRKFLSKVGLTECERY